MIVYHFLKEKYALESLEHKRLKVSLLSDLNDPFELHSVNLSNHEQKYYYGVLKNVMAENMGILCFSKKYSNPVLWSHYADRHKGVALEFAVFDTFVRKVNYRKTRSNLDFKEVMKQPDKKRQSTILRLMTTKYKDWEYEEEYRAIIGMDEIFFKKKIPFINIDMKVTYPLKLKVFLSGIVIGPLSTLTDKEIEENLPQGNKISVTRTKLAGHSFRVIKDTKKLLSGKG